MMRGLALAGLLVPSLAHAAPLVADTGDDVASLAAFCKTLDESFTCSIGDNDKIADLAKPVAPYLAARLFPAGFSSTSTETTCYLGIQTKRGWTVASLGSDCWSNGKYYRRLSVGELAVRATGQLWLRYAVESSDPDADGRVTEEFVVICGMTEEQPRCTAPIAIGSAVDGKPRWQVKASLSKGALVLALAKGKRAALPAETAARLGKSALVFEP